jgi:preprotein translocase subunit SecE
LNVEKESEVADKVAKPKQPELVKPAEKARTPEKDKGKEKVKQPNAISRWWKETLGELRKVSWPTPQEAWRLTKIVLVVMLLMSLALGLMDYIFSYLITAIVAA